jgi:type IV pilus assembly protein PilE
MKVPTTTRVFRTAGFTLIELLTVMVIAGVLIAIAVPSYTAQTRKSRRTEARTALLDLAGREERFFSTTNTYSDKPVDLGYGTAEAAFPMVVGSGYYTVTVQLGETPPATYTLTAEPVVGKGQEKDAQCASFTVAHTGKQTAENSAGTDSTSNCWG